MKVGDVGHPQNRSGLHVFLCAMDNAWEMCRLYTCIAALTCSRVLEK